MWFKPDAAKLIKAGRKTQERRPAHTNPPIVGKRVGIKTSREKPVDTYITITDLRLERLGDLTFKDARKEGFRTTQDFREHWIEEHGEHDADQLVHVISFELGDLTDTPRLLAKRPGPGHDYVTSASQAQNSTGEEVSAHLHTIYTAEAEQGLSVARNAQWDEAKLMMAAAINNMRLQAFDPVARKRLRSIEHHAVALDRERC